VTVSVLRAGSARGYDRLVNTPAPIHRKVHRLHRTWYGTTSCRDENNDRGTSSDAMNCLEDFAITYRPSGIRSTVLRSQWPSFVSIVEYPHKTTARSLPAFSLSLPFIDTLHSLTIAGSLR
jgi:hypothetical protein